MKRIRAGTASGNRGPTRRLRWHLALLLVAFLSGVASEGFGQKLRNRGTIVNRGTLAVVDSVIGMPTAMGGTVRLFGPSQYVPSSEYQNLDLVSPAVTTKQAAGSMTVLNDLTIGANVTLQMPADSVITLGMANGRLTEQGYISGKIRKDVELSGTATNSDFGGIGVSISWAGAAPGLTTITRTSGSAIASAGKNSIKRYFDVTASQNGKGDLTFTYATDELQGQDPSSLDLWRLPVGESQWRRQRVTRSGNTLTRISTDISGRFTAADVSNPLSPVINYEYEPATIASAGVDSSSGSLGQFLDSLFVARVVDAFGQPVAGVTVQFTVTSKPAGSTTDSLTVSSGVTGADGILATRLRLGEVSGRYIVRATLPSYPDVFGRSWIGYSRATVATMVIFSGGAQSDTVRNVLATPLAVRLADSSNVGVYGSQVLFRIISTPVGGENAALSDSVATSDGQGVASTGMVLGSKAGTYRVEARSLENDSLVAQFTVTATHGAPTLFTFSASSTRDTVLKALPAFVATITDTEGNPVPNTPVRLVLTSTPTGAVGAGLADTAAVTDSAGTALAHLTLGNRTGVYVVEATSTSIAGMSRTISATALPAKPVMLALVRGSRQTQVVLQPVDTAFTVRVSDVHDNPVPDVIVRYALTGSPAGATGQSFAAADTTDSLGIAESRLTVGSRTGRYVMTAASDSIVGSTVSFEVTGTHGPASAFVFNPPSAQGVVNSTVGPYNVSLQDAQGNPVPGALVRFSLASVPSGAIGHSIVPDSASTDSSGLAAVSVTLGNRTGLYSVTAQTAAFTGATPSLTITATPMPVAQLVTTQGASQRQQVLRLADSALVVKVIDSSGNAVSNVQVQFSIVSAPAGAAQQALSVAIDTTGSDGLASSQLLLGTKIGHYVVSATTPLLSEQVTFDVLATHGAAADLLTAAPVTQDTVTRELTPFTVAVVDTFGNPIPNARVRFTVSAAPAGAVGQSLDAADATTDSSGQAFVRLTLGDKAGTYEVTAVADVLPSAARVFQATATAAGASVLAEDLGDAQARPIFTTLDTAFVTRVADRFGNPVRGVPVRFAVVDSPNAATGQLLSQLVDTTDALGQASTVLRLGLKVGVYAVQANAPGLSPVLFTARAMPGAPKSIAGIVTDSVAFVSSDLAPFVVTVRDTGANLVPNASVAFTIVQQPAGATGTALSVLTGVTDSLGQISTSLRVGDLVGQYTVRAIASNLPPTDFTVVARSLMGNANADVRIDIGDLTAIIDHILGRSTLTGLRFRAADVDSNNVVDVRDAVIARNYLLSGGIWNIADTVLNPVLFRTVREDRALTPSISLADVPSSVVGGALGSPANTQTMLEHTSVGIRVNLTNEVPVKGVQIYLRSKRPISALDADVRFNRARNMDILVTATTHEVRAVVYNFGNVPIDSGSGPIFRIPIAGLDTTDIDSVAVIVSTGPENASILIDQQQVVKVVGQYPTTFALYQNYPNPFNSETFIEYDVPEISGRIPRVAIQIFNVVGEKVRTIDRQDRDAGRYMVRWDGRDDNGALVASGVYFYRLLSVDPVEGKHFATTKKMIMVK